MTRWILCAAKFFFSFLLKVDRCLILLPLIFLLCPQWASCGAAEPSSLFICKYWKLSDNISTLTPLCSSAAGTLAPEALQPLGPIRPLFSTSGLDFPFAFTGPSIPKLVVFLFFFFPFFPLFGHSGSIWKCLGQGIRWEHSFGHAGPPLNLLYHSGNSAYSFSLSYILSPLRGAEVNAETKTGAGVQGWYEWGQIAAGRVTLTRGRISTDRSDLKGAMTWQEDGGLCAQGLWGREEGEATSLGGPSKSAWLIYTLPRRNWLNFLCT